MRITFNRAGLKIRGHVFGKAPHPQDAVILSHGFMANERMCHKYAKLLAEMGFLTVTFDFCGGGIFSRSDGLSQDMTLFTEKADLLTVVKSIKKWFSPKSITLLGCSQGGFVSGLLAAELGEKVVDRLMKTQSSCNDRYLYITGSRRITMRFIRMWMPFTRLYRITGRSVSNTASGLSGRSLCRKRTVQNILYRPGH